MADTKQRAEVWLTTDQVARRWHVDRASIHRLIVGGKLPALNVGCGEKRATWRIRESDVFLFEHNYLSGAC